MPFGCESANCFFLRKLPSEAEESGNAPETHYEQTFSEPRLSKRVFEPFTRHRCRGHGRSKCGLCHGAGRIFPGSRQMCAARRGSRRGLKQEGRCQLCSGAGRRRRNTCSGRGSKTCATCQGEKKLQLFKQLAVTWKNDVFEFVSEHHLNFPGELLSKIGGENVFKDENVVVRLALGAGGVPSRSGCEGGGV
ncbi:protein SSUH2 homolog [Tyto alba]|uniref:protein SSUH2 homolog n=1 Tax=Tyto alba TaxID=56313 RepID=UPI001C66CA83|nr:protein SSUH2 homolog [Tyto alba]